MPRPSEARYRKFLAVLTHAKKAVDAAEDEKARLVAALPAFQGVISYLLDDVEVRDGALTSPLALIETAVFDASQGASVPLLEHPPERPGRPVYLARESVQGCLAFAMELLKRGGKMGTELAASRITAEARKQNVRAANGSPIDAKQIKNWRTDISRGKAPAGARETFEELRRMPDHALLLGRAEFPDKRKRCEVFAMAIVQSLAAVAPRVAPSRIRRG